MKQVVRLKWAGAVVSICALMIVFAPRTSGQQTRKTTKIDGRDALAGEVLVKFRRVLRGAEMNQLHVETDADLDRGVGRNGVRRLRSRSYDIQKLLDFFKTHPDVEYAEPNYVVHATALPNDPAFPQLWALRNVGQVVNGVGGTAGADIRATTAWDVTTGSIGNVVAVIDTGLNYNHPDLAPNVWSAPAEFTVNLSGGPVTCPQGTHGYNTVTGICDPMDDSGHGSHVSGTIGARGNNNSGVAGINWTTRIMGLKFLDSNGNGTVSDAVDAIEFAIQAKAAFAGTGGANVRVLSNSWGGEGYSQTLFDEISKANTNDMLFVAAAGNAGQNNDTAPSPNYPSSFDLPNIVSVAATDSNDLRAGFSNYGAASVDLAAPGTNILSTALGNSFGYLSGTSMATPHVSGAAMLVLSRCSLSVGQLRSALLTTVDPIGALAGVVSTGGRLNVDRAVRSCGTGAPAQFGKMTPYDNSIGFPLTGTISWQPSAGATRYEYCVDTVANGLCDNSWVPTSSTSASLSGLSTATTYYWQARAVNGSTVTQADGGIWWKFTTQPTTTNWFDSAWTYRRPIAVANVSGAALTDYLVELSIDAGFDFSKAAANGSDVRITDNSGTLALPFWIESWNPAASRARVWVKVPSVSVGGTTLYIYYGNTSGSSLSNGNATFDAYDGFEDLAANAPPAGNGSLTWTPTGNIVGVSNPVHAGFRSLRQRDFTQTTGAFPFLGKGSIAGWFRRDSTSSATDDIYLYGSNGALLAVVGFGAAGTFHYWDGADHDTGIPWSAAAWYRVTLSFDALSRRYAFAVIDDSLATRVNVSGVNFAGSAASIGSALLYTSSAFTGNAYVDDFRVVKWTGTEATSTIGSEETAGGTPPPVPGAFGKTAPGNGAAGQPVGPTLSWGASSGASSYQYCVDTTMNGTCDTTWTTAAGTSATLSGLAAGTTYSWQARAVNSAGTTQADGGAWWTFATQTAPLGGWLDPAWLYRRAVTVTNATGGALSNYQLQLTLDSSFSFTHAASDGRDVRVTDASGTAVVPFWVEAWDATAQRAAVWAKIPSLPPGTTTIYVYYGNAAAASAGAAGTTFDIYDGFEGLAVGGRPGAGSVGVTWGSSSAAAVSSPVRQGSRSVRQQDFTATTATVAAVTKGTLGAWLRRDSTSGGSDDIYFYGANGTLVGLVGLSGTGRFHYWDGSDHDTGIAWTAGSWYRLHATFDAALQRFDVTIVDAALAPKVQVSGVNFAGTAPSVGSMLLYTSSAYTGAAYADDVRLVKWTGAEVTYSLGTEQTP